MHVGEEAGGGVAVHQPRDVAGLRLGERVRPVVGVLARRVGHRHLAARERPRVEVAAEVPQPVVVAIHVHAADRRRTPVGAPQLVAVGAHRVRPPVRVDLREHHDVQAADDPLDVRRRYRVARQGDLRTGRSGGGEALQERHEDVRPAPLPRVHAGDEDDGGPRRRQVGGHPHRAADSVLPRPVRQRHQLGEPRMRGRNDLQRRLDLHDVEVGHLSVRPAGAAPRHTGRPRRPRRAAPRAPRRDRHAGARCAPAAVSASICSSVASAATPSATLILRITSAPASAATSAAVRDGSPDTTVTW